MYKTYQNKLTNRLCYSRTFVSYLYIIAYYCCLIILIVFLCYMYVFIVVLYFLNLLQFLLTFCYSIFTLFKKINNIVFLPSSRSPEDIFVFFSKGVLAFLRLVGFFSLIFLALGWQDGCVSSLPELSSSKSATEQQLNILKLYNIRMLIVYCTNYSVMLSKILFSFILFQIRKPEITWINVSKWDSLFRNLLYFS